MATNDLRQTELLHPRQTERVLTMRLRFLKSRPLLVKAVIQGSYQWNEDLQGIEFVANHTARFDYEFEGAGFRVAGAGVFKKGLSTPIHRVVYRYADNSMLASAAPQ